ncbi:MAG: polysaccharide pyruvyl transferase family protein [Reichenbachiella sp.]|uniref:polysaccharide pyruvyl transferase family protein n=1 Tax=Reichenbachiella sp. TaxID=2184521 RepID=UPI003264F4F4
MKNVLLVCDNRDSIIWGCRATSLALLNIINQNSSSFNSSLKYLADKNLPIGSGISHFINRQIVDKKSLVKINMILKNTGITKMPWLFNLSLDYIDYNPTISLKRFLKNYKKNDVLLNFYKKVEASDKVIINGEGSFIFTKVPRRDHCFQLFTIELAKYFNKEAYLVNAMMSPCPDTGLNTKMLDISLETLQKCEQVYLRDKMSGELLDQHGSIGQKIVPDALFTWKNYYPQSLKPEARSDRMTFYSEDIPAFNDSLFPDEYICISGASVPRSEKDRKGWTEYFVKLVSELKSQFHEELILVNPGGDSFLKEVSEVTNLRYIDSSTNVMLGANILSNAKMYLSGRYHPSIMAALGGTPCVFFGSNSHKTMSLQHLLNYETEIEHKIGDAYNIELIVDEALNKYKNLKAIEERVNCKVDEHVQLISSSYQSILDS